MMRKKGYLVLEDGKIFEGFSFGEEKDVSGEIVFNTGMVGYPESFTDPSYFGQILIATYPLIGNYGVPSKDISKNIPQNWESDKIQIQGLIVSKDEESNTHWQSVINLSKWLKKEGIPALSGVDTRTLTKIIREKGVMKAFLTFSDPPFRRINFYDINSLNLVAKVSCKKPVSYGNGKLRILLLDCGLKFNQIRLLLNHDATVIRVPWNYDFFDPSRLLKFDALVISNGPGNPKMVKETVNLVKEALSRKIPTLGICLGNQILALAAGANTYKLKYGHRGQNQPVIDEFTRKCFITTQNHGFAVDTKTLSSGFRPWFTNLNDHTNEGIKHEKLPFLSSQFHPEAAPGPTDTEWIFGYFIEEAKKWLKIN